MPDGKNWPDPERPGFPEDPTQHGPHLIEDQYGIRRWAWWIPTNGTGGFWTYASGSTHGQEWTYIGPAKTPDGEPVLSVL
jgi:hypothetical protein